MSGKSYVLIGGSLYFFNAFLTLIFSPFYKLPNESKFFKLLAYFDQILFKLKIFRIFAWSVLITAKKN